MPFAPGSAALSAQATAGLDRVAKVLADRPVLIMTVTGMARLDVEREGYKRERLQALVVAWRAWRYADAAARDQSRPAMLALAVTVFPLNTHLAAYSTFWGGVLLLLAALYAGSLLGREPA